MLYLALNDAPPSYRNSNTTFPMSSGGESQTSSKSSFSEVMAKKTKALKNKFTNFWYERKGYKRVNVSEDANLTKEKNGGRVSLVGFIGRGGDEPNMIYVKVLFFVCVYETYSQPVVKRL